MLTMNNMTRTRQFITVLVLSIFLVTAILGFATMAHGPDEAMEGFAMVSEHMSVLQAFLGIPAQSFALVLAVLALIISLALTLVFGLTTLGQIQFSTHLSHSPPRLPLTQKLCSWLSLLEHSPAVT